MRYWRLNLGPSGNHIQSLIDGVLFLTQIQIVFEWMPSPLPQEKIPNLHPQRSLKASVCFYVPNNLQISPKSLCRGWAETKPKVWFRSRNFGFWIKLSVSVDFGFCKTARFWRQTDKTAKKKAERFFFLHLFQKVKAKYWIPLSELKVRFCFHFLK